MKILGIESSADETASAVVEDGRKMLSNVVASSLDLHTAYGGIVPEIAARSHIESIVAVVDQALAGADCDWSDIDAIAVTNRPGLIGSLLIGVMTARTLAIVKNKPLYGINHVLAHAYANFITSTPLPGFTLNTSEPAFPALGLIVSGGHTQLMLYKGHTDYEILGQTRDDAVGEAFDKVAKILGLPYPGGPSVDKAAAQGDPTSVKLPRARLENPYDFSFSGLKTAVLRAAQNMSGHDFTFPSNQLPDTLDERQKSNLAASFVATAVTTLADTVENAAQRYKPKSIFLAGGVAANRSLREELARRAKAPLFCPDIKLCTDNAAMLASAAYYWHQPADNPYKLAVIPSL
ncbi:MAG TPA: tRNA (adenosine(37)-N6)-threonylcarbamoyltransferase complex transferase subunit TsaD [Candidatus Saccharimonadales bacterium]|nr:tRNA (adenosine(37)-N6)-threonylcarbamoyltransferase complex transferase subunit TsaD [Candidatus Saccharimonadales bacterium]